MPFRYAIKAEPPAPAPTGGATPQGTGTPGKRSRSEVARLAALARWGKYKPGQKPKPKGRKPAATPEAKEAARRQAAMDNRATVAAQLGMDAAQMDSLGTFAMGGALDPKQAKTLFDAGLITTNDDGSFRVTPMGRQFYNAASRGEVGQARDALAQGSDTAAQARAKEEARIAKEGEQPDEEKPKGGGGGGGGGAAEKPDKAAQATEQRDKARAAIGNQMAQNDEGLSPSGTAALLAFADGEPLDKALAPGLREMGLTEGDPPRLSSGARAAIAAMGKGDYRATVDAINAAKERKDTADARTKDRETRQAERDQDKADRAARATERRIPLFQRASAKMVEGQDSAGGLLTGSRFRKKQTDRPRFRWRQEL